jgi:hypothetical protein
VTLQQTTDVTIEQARAVQAVSPAAWQIVEAPGGWAVRVGAARLVVTNGRRERVFKTVDAAVRQLRTSLGVHRFEVVTSNV